MIGASPPRFRAAAPLLILALCGCPSAPSGPSGLKPVQFSGFQDASKETAEALKIVGFEHVYVYTWQGGRLGGFVEFDGPKKLDVSAMADAATSTMNNVAKAEGVTPDQVHSHGLVLFAIKPVQDSAKERECFFGLRISWEAKVGTSKKSGEVTRRETGTISDFHNYGGSEGSETRGFHINSPDGEKHEVFQFHLVPPKPPGKS